MVKHDTVGFGGAGDDLESLPQSRGRIIRRRIQRGEELRQIRLQLFAPRQRLGHAVHAASNRAKLARLILRQRRAELSLRHPLQRVGDAGKGRRQPAAVVPESESQHAENGREQHAGGDRGLDGIVAGIRGQLGRSAGFGGDHRGWAEALNALEPLRQLDHRRLRGAGTPPSRDLCNQADERHGDERRREDSGDARRTSSCPHGAP